MTEHTFELEEARRTLPLVRLIVRDVREAQQRLESLRERALTDWSRSTARPEEEYLARSLARQEERRDVQAQLESLENELGELGCRLEDCRLGVVGYPSVMDGASIYLCWVWNEADIRFYRDARESTLARRLLPGKSSQNLRSTPPEERQKDPNRIV
jgi:hypothetical protein